MPPSVETALAAWRAAVGDAHVSTAPEVLDASATATFTTSHKVVAILRPACAAQVGDCLHIAGHHGVPLYPVSRGRNWGLGSRVPTADGCAVLDLGRLDAITAFDATMGTITLQPGVTFRQVQTYLQDANARWFLPVIGGPAEASVIGNLAERGDGAGPTGDRAANACALQVVLPNGSTITTGFGMFPGAAMTTLSRAGPGPSLDGLFLQSGMGVIASATLFLSPIPTHLSTVRIHVAGKKALAAAINAARTLAFDGVLQPNCFSIWNATKVYMRGRSYPWAALGGRTPLPLHGNEAAQIWYMVATIHAASPAIGAVLSAHAAAAFTAAGATVEVFDEASRPGLRAEAAGALGAPDDVTAASVYWRKRAPPPSSLAPEADRCGVQWLCFALPLDGAIFAEVAGYVEDAAFQHSFEAVISGPISSPRAIHLFVALIYDRDVPGQDEAAQACHDQILGRLAQRGLHPMRLGIQAMDHLSNASEPYAALMQSIRSAIDPQGILAPGRYSFF